MNVLPEKLLGSEFISQNLISYLESRNVSFIKKEGNKYFFQAQEGLVEVTVTDTEVLLINKYNDAYPIAQTNIKYGFDEYNNIQKSTIVIDFSKDYSVLLETSTYYLPRQKQRIVEMRRKEEYVTISEFELEEKQISLTHLLDGKNAFQIFDELRKYDIGSSIKVIEKSRNCNYYYDDVVTTENGLYKEVNQIPEDSLSLEDAYIRKY